MTTECFTYEEFKIHNDIAELPFDSLPKYVHESVGGICLRGTALMDVFSNKRRISSNDLIVLFPYQFVSIKEVSDDFSIVFFKIPYSMSMDITSGMCRMTPNFMFYMRKNYTYKLTDDEAERFLHFCNALNIRIEKSHKEFFAKSLIHILRVFFWDIYVHFKSNPNAANSIKYSYKEELVFKFLCLVIEHYNINRNVAFYANKLCVSPKYLTMVIKEISGKSAKEYIIEYTILEIKALLQNSAIDIKEIVSRTQFPNQSLLSRFFRKHTGMSPSQYRNRIHMQ